MGGRMSSGWGGGGGASQVTYWRCQKPHRWRNAARGHQPETYSDDLPLSSAEIILGYVRKEGSRSVSPRLAPKTRGREPGPPSPCRPGTRYLPLDLRTT